MISTLTASELTKFTAIVTGCRYYGTDGKRGSERAASLPLRAIGIGMSVGPRVLQATIALERIDLDNTM